MDKERLQQLAGISDNQSCQQQLDEIFGMGKGRVNKDMSAVAIEGLGKIIQIWGQGEMMHKSAYDVVKDLKHLYGKLKNMKMGGDYNR